MWALVMSTTLRMWPGGPGWIRRRRLKAPLEPMGRARKIKGGCGETSSSPGIFAVPVSFTSKREWTYWISPGCMRRMGVASSSKSGFVWAQTASGASARALTVGNRIVRRFIGIKTKMAVALLQKNLSHHRGSRGDLQNLVGNGGLPRLVVGEGQVLDQLLGVVSRALHGDHACAVLGGARFQHLLVQAEVDVVGQQAAEQDFGVRLEIERHGGLAVGIGAVFLELLALGFAQGLGGLEHFRADRHQRVAGGHL